MPLLALQRAVRTAIRTMSTLTKPYEAQQFEAREEPPVGDPILRVELEMDRLQKQLQAVKVERASLQEKGLACALFEFSLTHLCIPSISLILVRVHCLYYVLVL